MNSKLRASFWWGSVPMESVVISFNTTTNTGGTIGGAAGTAEFEAALAPGARAVGICPGNATYEQVVATLRQSADLVLGAPNLQNTTVTSKEAGRIRMSIGPPT